MIKVKIKKAAILRTKGEVTPQGDMSRVDQLLDEAESAMRSSKKINIEDFSQSMNSSRSHQFSMAGSRNSSRLLAIDSKRGKKSSKFLKEALRTQTQSKSRLEPAEAR